MNTHAIFHRLTLGLAFLALPATALAADGFARSSGTLRAGPGTNYPAIMRIASGTDLDVIGCIRRYSWCDVAIDGERGWYPGSRIGFLRDGRRLSLSEGGAALGLTILTFGMADYWGNHYSERPWYNERRWWRGQAPMPARPPIRPGEVRSPEPAPPPAARPGADAGHPPVHAAPTGEVRPPVHRVEPPKARTPHPIVEPMRPAPRGVVGTDPPRKPGGGDGKAPPQEMKRPQAPQHPTPGGDGPPLLPPSGN